MKLPIYAVAIGVVVSLLVVGGGFAVRPRKLANRSSTLNSATHPLISDSSSEFRIPAPLALQLLNETLLLAAEDGDIAKAKKCLNDGADINAIEDDSNNFTPLTYAAQTGNIGMTDFLLNHGANTSRISDKNSRPIDFAAYEGEVTIVHMLIEHMPRLSTKEKRKYLKRATNAALNKATDEKKLTEIKRWGIEEADVNNFDADVSRDGQGNPLMHAVYRGSPPLFDYLLEHGAKVNLQDSNGRTSLMYTGRTDMYFGRLMPYSFDLPSKDVKEQRKRRLNGRATRILVRRGAKVNVRDNDGKTALMYAAQGNPEASAILLAHGAKVNLRDKTGHTALHYAAIARDAKSIELLLRYGASVNALDKSGVTALMLANVKPESTSPTRKQENATRLKCLKLLRRFGAKAHFKDSLGQTAGDYSKLEDGYDIDGC